MTGDADDDAIAAVAAQLRERKTALGAAYWSDDEVQMLRDQLRRLIAQYGAWSPDRPGMHQRARQAATLESTHAGLLWPGRGDDK